MKSSIFLILAVTPVDKVKDVIKAAKLMKKGDHLLDGVKLTAKELEMLRDLEKSGERVKIVEKGTDSAKTVDKVNDARKYNNTVMEEIARRKEFYRKNDRFDCSEIADDLLDAAGGKGKIIEITPKSGVLGDLQVKEYGKIQDFDFHTVYSDGKYIYDPRYNDLPILENDYFNMLESLNPSGICKKIQ